MFSTGVATLVGTPVYIGLARRFDTRWLMMVGMACFGLAMWQFSFVTSGWSGGELLIPQLLCGFPQVFAVAASVNLGLDNLPPERLRYASGLFNMMRNLGGAVGSYPGSGITLRPAMTFNDIAAHPMAGLPPWGRCDVQTRLTGGGVPASLC